MSETIINDKNLTIGIIILILMYIILCGNLHIIQKKNQKMFHIDDKLKFYLITMYAYILGILITCYEVCVLSEVYHNNITLRITEFLFSIIMIGIILYSYTFQNDVNSEIGNICIYIWPFLTTFLLVSILCLNSIYEYYSD